MPDDIRRSQLAGVFGVGSLRIMVGGISMICGSLDHWLTPITKRNSRFEGSTTDSPYEDQEWQFDEYRLRSFLGVDYFNYPPQYRKQSYRGTQIKNAEIIIPYFLFPRYMYCSNNVGSNKCGRLKPRPPSLNVEELEKENKLVCDECKVKAPLYQVNIITVCDNGHIDDFPWFEWAHIHKKENNCNKYKLEFKQRVVNGIATQQVTCSSCKASATLEDCFYNLNNRLPNLKCTGNTPWFGPGEKENCELQPEAIYRSGSSVYSPVVRSSLYIPIGDNNNKISELNDKFKDGILNNYRIRLSQTLASKNSEEEKNKLIKSYVEINCLPEVENDGYTAEDVENVLRFQMFGKNSNDTEEKEAQIKTDQEFKEEEYKVLSQNNDTRLLVTEVQDVTNYSEAIQEYINGITLVKKLTETRALVDFTRRKGVFELDTKDNSKLWRDKQKYGERWLPAVQNTGEGIFIKFNSEKIDAHSKKENVKARLKKLDIDINNKEDDSFKNYTPNLSLVFVHTFSHLLINEMAYYSGYNTASISERLYIKQDDDTDMSGLLIYTAAGDEEGTLGGLIKLSSPDIFNNLFEDALEKARWCSTDPVCNDVGTQGPYNKNLGACHSCALLPETSCQDRNCFLDRGVVVGTQYDRELGLIKTKDFII